jgi:hypothetical protein
MKTSPSILALVSLCLLSACGGNDADHGHPHDDAAPASHAAESSDGDDAEHGHPHGEDTHSHDEPETEEFYGEDATNPTENAVEGDNGHPHGDDTHTHDGDEEGHGSTTGHGEDEDSVEPHGHDH